VHDFVINIVVRSGCLVYDVSFHIMDEFGDSYLARFSSVFVCLM